MLSWKNIFTGAHEAFLRLLFILLVFGGSGLTAGAQARDNLYKEYVDLHLGRHSFIAGEVIPLKAYCFSNLQEPDDFISKALYIELIDINQHSVLSQVLYLEGNTAAAILQIPDTLHSGSYSLKAYTNWMKNYGETYFYSHPVYIYNQYDEQIEESRQMILNPRIYIEGEDLLAGVPTRIKISIPGFDGIPVEGSIREGRSGKIICKFHCNSNGEALFRFTPQENKQYIVNLGDSLNNSMNYFLPLPGFSGFALRIEPDADDMFRIRIYSRNLRMEKLLLKTIANGQLVSEIPVNEFRDSVVVQEDYKTLKGAVKIGLFTSEGDMLCCQTLIRRSDSVSGRSYYSILEEVDIRFDLSAHPSPGNGGLSASVHKVNAETGTTSNASYSACTLTDNYDLLLSRLWDPGIFSGTSPDISDPAYLAEDLGILYSGTVQNPVNNVPIRDIDVVLALKDTLGVILAARTDESGRFGILVDEWGNKQAYISLYMNGMSVSGNKRIYLDEKFYYRALNQGRQFCLDQITDTTYMNKAEDEAQRVLIQKAFGNTWEVDDTSFTSLQKKEQFLYGEPHLIVYPDEFFYLPNFEEIAREILPRVRYRHNNRGCILMVVHPDDNTRSENPIALVDGNLIANHCDLYSLDSDDIQRIEVLSGLRARGNLLYNGMVAIYTTPEFKKDNKIKNGRITYPVPGYMNNSRILKTESLEIMGSAQGKPDFKNQLYWNPNLVPAGDKAIIEFSTSDEEGDYVIDLLGYTKEGMPIHMQKKIRVRTN